MGICKCGKPDPSKWEKPHDYGEGKHAGDLEDDSNDEGDLAGEVTDGDPVGDDD